MISILTKTRYLGNRQTLAGRLFGAAIVAFAPLLGAQTDSSENLLSIGTGAASGVYFPTGGALCRAFERYQPSDPTPTTRCRVVASAGSIANLEALRAGQLDAAIVQSDAQYHAYNGSGEFQHQGAFEDLRALFSLHPEPFTVVARADAGVSTFDDLQGKRVNIGNPGSGQRATMEVVMAVKNWTTDVFAQTLELDADRQSQAMCEDQVDAIVYTVGHPNRPILQATAACDSVLVGLDPATVATLTASRPYYSPVTIGGGLYRNNPNPIATFGVTATLVASERLDPEIGYRLAAAVFEQLDQLRGQHPALQNLDRRLMLIQGNSAPLHAGVRRYIEQTSPELLNAEPPD